MADKSPAEFECSIAALLTIASCGGSGFQAVHTVNRYAEILAALRDAGGALEAVKKTHIAGR